MTRNRRVRQHSPRTTLDAEWRGHQTLAPRVMKPDTGDVEIEEPRLPNSIRQGLLPRGLDRYINPRVCSGPLQYVDLEGSPRSGRRLQHHHLCSVPQVQQT